MIKVCKMNSVNGENTGSIARSGMGKVYPATGHLLKKNCPNGEFKIDTADGGTNNYYRLVDPGTYGLPDPSYIWISKTYLIEPDPTELQNLVNNAPTIVNNDDIQSPSVTQTTSSADTGVINGTGSTQNNRELDQSIYEMMQNTDTLESLKSDARVLGIPFQFTNVADNRPAADSELNYGRKYLENIIAEAPIVYLTPGLPDYMPDADEEQKEAIDNYIKDKSAGITIDSEALDKVLETEGRYYGFVSAYTDYMKYVNLLCRICAIYMGIDEKTVPGTLKKYKEYNWSNWTNINYASSDEDSATTTGMFDALGDAIETVVDDVFADYKYIKVYADPTVSFNESGSNNSQQSQIVGLFDTMESIVKEIGFFGNGGSLNSLSDTLLTGAAASFDAGTEALDPNVSAGLSKIIKSGTHVLQGSNIIFPELWGDSSYNKSYSFTMNLVSPYGDAESVFLNIIVPMMHMIALSMPRQTSANSFGSPFLVKAFAKGWFSCDLGMVDSISIEKDPSSWNVVGLPNEVKIQISIKDLYPNLMISKSTKPALFFSNQGLIEFLAVTSGVNITKGNIGLKIDTIISTFASTLFDIPQNIYNDFIAALQRLVEPWVKLTK